MAISLKEIQSKCFEEPHQGCYNADQVDDFLDELTDEIRALQQDNSALTEQVTELQNRLDAVNSEKESLISQIPDYNEDDYFENLKETIREALQSAQRIADKTKSDAEIKATEILDNANADSESIKADAASQAEEIVANAEKQAKEIMSVTERKLNSMHQECEQIKGITKSYTEKVRSLLTSHMKALDDATADAEKIDELPADSETVNITTE